MSEESRKEGPWKLSIEELLDLGEEVHEAIRLGTVQNAEVLKDTIVGHFENQDLGWAGLSPEYLKRKKETGKSTATLIASATLMNSITIEIAPDGLEASVGVNRKSGRKDGVDPVLIGAVMEYGSATRNIPARPFLKPSFEEKKQDMTDRYIRRVEEALAAVAKRMGAQTTSG